MHQASMDIGNEHDNVPQCDLGLVLYASGHLRHMGTHERYRRPGEHQPYEATTHDDSPG